MLHHEIADSPELSFSAISLDEDQRCMSMSRLSTGNNLLAPTPLRRCRSASPATTRTLRLSPGQQRYIKSSWSRISKTTFGNSVLDTFFRSVDLDSSVLVNQDGHGRHARYIVELVQSCVDNVENLDYAVKPWLDMIGQGHANFRVQSKHWDKFAEALMSVATEWNMPGRHHKDTTRAWMLLTTYLADRLAHASRANQKSPMLTPRVQLLTGRPVFDFNSQ